MKLCFVFLLSLAASCAAQAPLELLDRSAPEATLEAFDLARGGEFTIGGARQSVAAGQLVRWGNPAAPKARPTLLLADGSRLVAADSWTDDGSIQLTGDEWTVLNVALARLNLPRGAVRAVLLAGGRDPELLAPVRSEVETPQSADTVWLVEGDRLTGELVSLTGAEVKFRAAEEEVTIPTERVLAVGLASKAPPLSADSSSVRGCWLGLADGSLLDVSAVTIGADGLQAALLGGAAVKCPRSAEVVLLGPRNSRVEYLSDRSPVDYQHRPYFQQTTEYAVDHNLHGAALEVEGRRYLKGLAMPSAARLTYKLADSAVVFQALVGVADSAQFESTSPGGSVVFQVVVIRGGQPEKAFDSGVVRVGEPPRPVKVDVAGAQGLALVVDYGEYGDARDDALWLDARVILR